jgi:hypothetical protein
LKKVESGERREESLDVEKRGQRAKVRILAHENLSL